MIDINSRERNDFLSSVDKLCEIASLQDNWNGYGACAFDPSVIKNALAMFSALEQTPFISPTARQSIQMEYEKSNGDYFEIEVYKDRIDVYAISGKKETDASFFNIDFDVPIVASMAKAFLGQQPGKRGVD